MQKTISGTYNVLSNGKQNVYNSKIFCKMLKPENGLSPHPRHQNDCPLGDDTWQLSFCFLGVTVPMSHRNRGRTSLLTRIQLCEFFLRSSCFLPLLYFRSDCFPANSSLLDILCCKGVIRFFLLKNIKNWISPKI